MNASNYGVAQDPASQNVKFHDILTELNWKNEQFEGKNEWITKLLIRMDGLANRLEPNQYPKNSLQNEAVNMAKCAEERMLIGGLMGDFESVNLRFQNNITVTDNLLRGIEIAIEYLEKHI